MARETKATNEQRAHAVKSCSFINRLKGGTPAQWLELQKTIGNLIYSNASLRGNIAHLLLYLISLEGRGRPELALQNSFRDYMAEVIDQLEKVTSIAWPNASDGQKFSQFIERSVGNHKDKRDYAAYVILLTGLAIEEGESFTNSHIFVEAGDLKGLIFRMKNSSERSSTVESLLDSVKDFSAWYDNKNRTSVDLGSFAEMGAFGSSNLWASIFDSKTLKEDEYGAEDSIESRYICYRFSSLYGSISPQIVKSFLVFQSPGKRREHFAFKLFYRSRLDSRRSAESKPNSKPKIRRSAGALIEMGDYIVCMGSSREVREGADQGVRAPDFVQSARGPKVIVFDEKHMRTEPALVMGLTLTVNEQELPLVGRICLVRTNCEHSRSVDMQPFTPGTFVDDLKAHTVFGTDKVWLPLREGEGLGRLANKVLENLQFPATNGLMMLKEMEQIRPHIFI